MTPLSVICSLADSITELGISKFMQSRNKFESDLLGRQAESVFQALLHPIG